MQLSTAQDKTKLIKEKANKRKQKRVDNIREAKQQRELNSDIKDKADENKEELHVQDEHIEEQPKSDPESNFQSDNEEKVVLTELSHNKHKGINLHAGVCIY